ncbi:hypothetical protein AMATHDRAFT_146891 [Amanita thiersii Skay4041]|uniref:Vacuolar sorting protein Vps3844 C-terminal domain-containing protein n=1 Tax=Amanita thiersii Skay4041 TaxID=703135 RepID=A0A2A9NN38_9AGAR|nr:hypothetical protein AMATHDRAFT_146891 [Amanita thiersii Skay4041]
MLCGYAGVVLACLLHASRAIDVYLHPQSFPDVSSLSLERGSFQLSRHLDLEIFEPQPFQDNSWSYAEDELSMGLGPRNTLLVTLDSADANAILPIELKRSFSISAPPTNTLDSVLYTYLTRARQSYSSIYGSSGPTWQHEDLGTLSSFLKYEESGFAAIELQDLMTIRLEYGSTSNEYQTTARLIRAFLQDMLSHASQPRLAILIFDTDNKRIVPRQDQTPLPPNQPPPQQPISSVSTCHTSEDVCKNATNSCSGRGQCAEATKSGRTCFVCTCRVTKTGEGTKTKTEIWVGESCERRDISGPFVLLTGSVVTLILLIVGSVSLLYGVGDGELPSTLLSTTTAPKRD